MVVVVWQGALLSVLCVCVCVSSMDGGGGVGVDNTSPINGIGVAMRGSTWSRIMIRWVVCVKVMSTRMS